MTILARSGKLASTDEVLVELSECISSEEYCSLMLYLIQFPVKETRRRLKRWALAHECELVRSVGEWM